VKSPAIMIRVDIIAQSISPLVSLRDLSTLPLEPFGEPNLVIRKVGTGPHRQATADGGFVECEQACKGWCQHLTAVSAQRFGLTRHNGPVFIAEESSAAYGNANVRQDARRSRLVRHA